MAQETMEVVRKPLRVRERSSRTFQERVFLRFPWLAHLSLRLLGRLAPSSRVRQAVMWRGFQQAVEAFNRRDFDALSFTRDPDFEFYPPPELVEAGFTESIYRGDAGYRKYVSEFLEVWGNDLRAEPIDLIDLGDRFVVLYDVPVRARASRIPLRGELATVAVVEDGRTVRQYDYLAHAEALEAVGLRE